MEVVRYNRLGRVEWKYESNSLYPLDLLYSSGVEIGAWILVRGLEDSSLTLGSKVLALDVRGRRLYTFFEESRKLGHLSYYKGALYFSSKDERGQIKVHSIISE